MAPPSTHGTRAPVCHRGTRARAAAGAIPRDPAAPRAALTRDRTKEGLAAMHRHSGPLLLAGLVTALAAIGLAALIVVRFSSAEPVITAAVLAAAAAVLGAVPPIIRALRGR